MEFPKTNKYTREQHSNARILEEKLRETDWRFLGKCYLVAFPLFVLSVFVLVFAINLALTLV